MDYGILMKVLVISHPCFNTYNNMGKTLLSLFSSYDKSDIRQLYLYPMLPDIDRCDSYYRITDTDALKSLFRTKSAGGSFTYSHIDTKQGATTVASGLKKKLYSFGRKRTSIIYIARNTIWRLSKWYSKELKQWIGDFAPDVIFFASGDYKFAYDIAYTISCDFDIPMVMYCCDDYYINRLNPQSLLSRPVHSSLMRSVRKCVSRSVGIITICDKLTEAYRVLFNKPIYTVYTGSSTTGEPNPDGKGIVYLGNLGFQRHKSLVDIGRALKRISEKTGEDLRLDVYSAEDREEILRELTEENGVVFHGAVDSTEVNRIISESRLVVHVESFNPNNIHKVQYSVSTKIADLLASGHCILAYGPGNVASMEYLQENNAACVISDREKLERSLENILNDREKRLELIRNAKHLAEKNHNGEKVAKKILKIIESALEVAKC